MEQRLISIFSNLLRDSAKAFVSRWTSPGICSFTKKIGSLIIWRRTVPRLAVKTGGKDRGNENKSKTEYIFSHICTSAREKFPVILDANF